MTVGACAVSNAQPQVRVVLDGQRHLRHQHLGTEEHANLDGTVEAHLVLRHLQAEQEGSGDAGRGHDHYEGNSPAPAPQTVWEPGASLPLGFAYMTFGKMTLGL